MTSTRGRDQAQVDACGRGKGVSAVWTFTQKIRAHPVFSCKEVGVFLTRISSWDWNKNVEIFRQYKPLV